MKTLNQNLLIIWKIYKIQEVLKLNKDSNKMVSTNKLAVIHVLAALIKNPLLFVDSKYDFSIDDFPEQFHRILFGAIEHLAKNGMETIGYIDIDQFLKQYTVQYQVFTANKGVEYIQNILALYDEKKFDYYYHTLKKHSLINSLSNAGIDTTDIYDPNIIDPVENAKMTATFDNLSVDDILLKEETKLILIKEKFGNNVDRVENHAGDGLRALKEKFKETPDIGLPLMSPKLTTIYRGQRRGCLFIESAPSGYGKALPNSTKIPTPCGWRQVGEIRVGDYLFDAKGRPTKVLNVFPQGEKQVYQITFSDGRVAKCCKEHLWSYNTCGQKPQSIEQRKFYTHTLEEIMQQRLKDPSGEYRFLVPQQLAVQYSEKKHKIHPYLMGLALGDGSFRISEKNNTFYFSSSDPELPLCFEKFLPVKTVKDTSVAYRWFFKWKEPKIVKNSLGINKAHENVWVQDFLTEHVELINRKSETKYIPREYLEDSIENRLEFLRGLLDTDGSVDAKGRVSYYTVSERMKNDVVELIRSLGYQTSVNEDKREGKRLCYAIRILCSPEEKLRLFNLKRKQEIIKKYYLSSSKQDKVYRHQQIAITKIEKMNYTEEMTCFLVDNEEHLFLTENFVVTHNSRIANGEACHLAIPEYYDTVQKRWVKTNLQESVLIISTELEEYECQQMWMAHVAGVPENNIKDGRYMTGEEERVDHAIDLIEKSNLYFASITNFDIEDVCNIIKKYKQLYNVNYVYFDYLGESLKLTAGAARQTKVSGLRTDQILLMFASALKDIAKTLNIYIWTASQLSGDYKNAKELDAGYLRSAKSIADKVDVGAILMPVREQDSRAIQDYCSKGFELQPNFVMNIYKVRAGSYQNIKVYVNFDRSTCQMHDCFITDANGEFLSVVDTNIEIILDSTKEEKFETAYTGNTKSNFDFDF